MLESTEPDTTPETTETTTTATTIPAVEVGPSGRGVRIDGVRLEGDRYLVDYRTAGYEPLISDDPSYHHIQFFFDTVAPENAGNNGPAPDCVGALAPAVAR